MTIGKKRSSRHLRTAIVFCVCASVCITSATHNLLAIEQINTAFQLAPAGNSETSEQVCLLEYPEQAPSVQSPAPLAMHFDRWYMDTPAPTFAQPRKNISSFLQKTGVSKSAANRWAARFVVLRKVIVEELFYGITLKYIPMTMVGTASLWNATALLDAAKFPLCAQLDLSQCSCIAVFASIVFSVVSALRHRTIYVWEKDSVVAHPSESTDAQKALFGVARFLLNSIYILPDIGLAAALAIGIGIHAAYNILPHVVSAIVPVWLRPYLSGWPLLAESEKEDILMRTARLIQEARALHEQGNSQDEQTASDRAQPLINSIQKEAQRATRGSP